MSPEVTPALRLATRGLLAAGIRTYGQEELQAAKRQKKN